MKKKIPGLVVRKWTTAKGVTKQAYYYRAPRSQGRKLTPLGTDYQQAIRKWAELHGAEVAPALAGTVADVYEKYMEWANNRKLSGLSPRTIKDREAYWGKPGAGKGGGKLNAAFGKAPIDSLRPEYMLTYFEARSSQISAKKELKFLSVLCNWARARGLMRAPNPTNDIMRQLSVNEKRDIYVEDSWYQLTWECGSQLVRDAMDFTYICGNRPNETESAKKSMVKNGELHIELAKTEKSGIRTKRLKVEGALKEYIERQQKKPVTSLWLVSDESGQPLKVTGSKFRKEWNEARDAAEEKAKKQGISYTRFRIMDIRAKAATDIAEKYGLEAARKLLGHTTQKQTADYIRSIQGIQAKAIELLNR